MEEIAAYDSPETVPAGAVPVSTRPAKPRFHFPQMSGKLREWLNTLQQDPSAEERATEERRARLLEELNRAVADAPDDMPLRDVITRVNHPEYDD